ncbi:hypothetical protein RASY3_09100 [Ruminococcus albus SY3]|uniref:Uncharacterized protein n=1 Tax=Ruminococcus albus SY3 TaxID=1341156 RepID=A0A011VY76_RUMAL|nr:hypothetical protein [Ruminococcus albus]EXM40261.1 hypothetical protein RASY3_09100 [Ruminococcus albus SY3]
MGRKADINNLIRDAEHKDKIVIDAENYLETAKANSAEAWVKVEKRRKELEQENNNALAEISKKLFWADISAEELQSKWDELLFIAEVKEYIDSEKAKHEAEIKRKAAEEAAKKKAENQYNAGVIDNNDAGNATVSETENVNSDAPNHTNNNVDNN